jgi:hypothetical protein
MRQLDALAPRQVVLGRHAADVDDLPSAGQPTGEGWCRAVNG